DIGLRQFHDDDHPRSTAPEDTSISNERPDADLTWRAQVAPSTKLVLMRPVVMPATVPPSTTMFSPVTYDASSLLRKIIGHACSTGSAHRPMPLAAAFAMS